LAGAVLVGVVAPVRGADPAEERDRAQLASMEAKIDRLIGKAACGDVGDCRAVAFGAKPCGGAWKYKIVSAKGSKGDEIAKEIEAYNAINAKLNREHGWMSDCSVVTPPAPECRQGRCVAASPPTAPAPSSR